jgi:hypothetical protein
MQEPPTDTRICLFIDGVDEYDGDHGALLELISSATTSERVKIVVSSRPIQACLYTFGSAGFRLEDWTRYDIQLYVKDQLLRHTLIQDAEQREAGITNTLVEEILSKTSGSFLLAVLILRQLSLDLEQGHNVPKILQAMQEVPWALEDLYELMLGSRHGSHQVSAAIIIQPVIHAFEVQESYTITLLQLSFIVERQPSKSLSAPIEPISESETLKRCQTTQGQLRTLLYGLLESQGRSDLEEGVGGLCVGFLHRTVIEFFRRKEIWDRLSVITKRASVQLDELLLGLCLLEMKQNPPRFDEHRLERAHISFINCLEYAVLLAKNETSLTYLRYLDEVYRVMQSYYDPGSAAQSPASSMKLMKRLLSQNALETFGSRAHELLWAYPLVEELDFKDISIKRPSPFFFLVALKGLHAYLAVSLRMGVVSPDDECLLLVHLVLFCLRKRQSLVPANDVHSNVYKAITLLLALGADPQKEVKVGFREQAVGGDDLACKVICGPDGQLSPWAVLLQFLQAAPELSQHTQDKSGLVGESDDSLQPLIRAAAGVQPLVAARHGRKMVALEGFYRFLVAIGNQYAGARSASVDVITARYCTAADWIEVSWFAADANTAGSTAVSTDDFRFRAMFSNLVEFDREGIPAQSPPRSLSAVNQKQVVINHPADSVLYRLKVLWQSLIIEVLTTQETVWNSGFLLNVVGPILFLVDLYINPLFVVFLIIALNLFIHGAGLSRGSASP